LTWAKLGEKHQLHSDDFKLMRRELGADSPAMKGGYTKLVAEMPAIGEVRQRNELAANELVGGEMEAPTKCSSGSG
jgi:hypothetical protein